MILRTTTKHDASYGLPVATKSMLRGGQGAILPTFGKSPTAVITNDMMCDNFTNVPPPRYREGLTNVPYFFHPLTVPQFPHFLCGGTSDAGTP